MKEIKPLTKEKLSTAKQEKCKETDKYIRTKLLQMEDKEKNFKPDRKKNPLLKKPKTSYYLYEARVTHIWLPQNLLK